MAPPSLSTQPFTLPPMASSVVRVEPLVEWGTYWIEDGVACRLVRAGAG